MVAAVLTRVAVAALVLPGAAAAATLNEFPISSPAQQIITGPGGLWFTESGTEIGMITTDGTLHEYHTGLTSGAQLQGIAVAGGDVWFTEPNENKVGEINTTNEQIKEFSTGIPAGSDPAQIVLGTDGNLWFTEPGTSEVAKINPTTDVITQYGAINGISAGSEPTGIAVGPGNNLWFTETAGDRIGEITTSGVATEFSSGLSSGAKPLGIVAGPDGALWFTESQQVDGYRQIGRITTSGTITQFQLPYNGSVNTPDQIAVAPGGRDLILSENYNGVQGAVDRLSTVGATGGFAAPSSSSVPDGLTAGSDGNIWIAENGNIGQLVLNGADAPSATSAAPTDVTDADATLNGSVNPAGDDTGYVFEYGTSASYGSVTDSSDAGSGTSSTTENASLSDLTPDTNYYYRIDATNIDGDAHGSPEHFQTSAGAVAPTVTDERSDNVTATTADLEATINPNGATTTYHFEWGTTTAYGNTVPVPDGSLAAGNSPQVVSVQVTGLPSGTLIHFRLDATNSANTTNADDQTLTTFTQVAAGSPGALDTSFGTGGAASFAFGDNSFNGFNAVARQTDGKIIYAGYADEPGGTELAIVRVDADGSADTSFGTGGTVLIVSPLGTATGVAVQSNGAIVIAGNQASGTGEVIRLTSSGALDTTFDSTGEEGVSFGGTGPQKIAAVAIDPTTQDIVVAGSATFSGSSRFALARLTPSGNLDSSFGTGGIVTTGFPSGASAATALAIEADGEPVAAGTANGSFAAALYTTAGTLDSSFGSDGLATPATPGSGIATTNALALQSDGKIVIAGGQGNTATVVRLNSSGSLDDTFGSGGATAFTVPGTTADSIAGVAEDPAGNLLVAGQVVMDGDQYGFASRLTAGGAVDTTFGEQGYITSAASSGWTAIAAPSSSSSGEGSAADAILADTATSSDATALAIVDAASGGAETCHVTIAAIPAVGAEGSGTVAGHYGVGVVTTVSGGTPPYTWAYISTNPLESTRTDPDDSPRYWSAGTQGLEPGIYAFTFSVTDSSTPTCSATTTITVNVGSQTTTGGSPPCEMSITATSGVGEEGAGTVAGHYPVSVTTTVSGGTPPYTWVYIRNNPLNSTRTDPDDSPRYWSAGLQGLKPGRYAITFSATDSSTPACSATTTITIEVGSETPANHGISVPARGLVVSSDVADVPISCGQPATGPCAFLATLVDTSARCGHLSSRPTEINVTPANHGGFRFATSLSGDGGAPPYSFALLEPAPTGVTVTKSAGTFHLKGTGTLASLPVQATVEITDSSGCSGTQTIALRAGHGRTSRDSPLAGVARSKVVALGAGRVTVKRGAKGTLKIRLTAAGARLLEPHKQIHVRLRGYVVVGTALAPFDIPTTLRIK